MPELPGPGERGYNPDSWFQRVVNVGLGLARHVGLGLPLFNALRGRFGGVLPAIIGQAATVIGQGVRAASDWMQGGPDHLVNLDDLPIAPKGFFGPGEVDRVVGLFDQPGRDPQTGGVIDHRDKATWPEDWSKAAIQDALQEIAGESNDSSPSRSWQADFDATQHMLWIGKRY